MRIRFVRRLAFIFTALFLFALLIVGRLYFVQVVEGDTYSVHADQQYVLPNQNLYDRGSIFFRDADNRLVAAAALRSGFTVAMRPALLEDPELVYERLAEIIKLDREDFLARAAKKDDPYEVIAKRVPNEKALAISALSIPGVDIYKERWRYYPGGKLGAHGIGFVAYQGDELAGRYGLERFWDATLERDRGGVYVNFFAEAFSDVRDLLFDRDTHLEGNIVTAIEPTVQTTLESELERVAAAWGSKHVGGIIMDPKTGAIHALGVYPTFDLNAFQKEASVEAFTNPLAENVFEMGSIIKPITIAAGLDAGVVSADTTYTDTGSIVVNGSKVSNFDGEARGTVPLQEILNQSLNTGAAFVEQRLGNERFADYLRAFGVAEKTGVDLPGEAAPLVGNLESPRDIEYVTASFGQGIAMTPIATARALAVLGNGGVLIQPHLAEEIHYENGLRKTIDYAKQRRVISEATAEEITRMLVAVVDDALAEGERSMEHYSIAAKTGTAQIADSENGGYYDDRFLHSFFGYFPAYNPRFLIFLYNLEPVGARYASQTLTDPFMNLTQFLINYYDIPPDR